MTQAFEDEGVGAKAGDKVIAIAPSIGSIGLKICVFCSAYDLAPQYTEPAKQFARLIAEHGHTLIWGGSDTGLMSQVASAAQEAGGRIVGISVEFLRHKVRQSADEMVIAKDLGERKALLLARSDVVVVMPGGVGTLDETTEIVEHRKHGHHDKPIIVMNTDGFYDGLATQFQRMDEEGFLPKPVDKLLQFTDTPEATMALIEQQLL